MTSLFGPTPAQIEEARQQQIDEQIAGEGRELGPFRGLYQAARRLGSAGGRTLMSGLFPEAQDPALRQAQAVQLVQQKYQGQNLGDPSVLKSIASDLFTAGAPEAGLRILKTVEELTPKDKLITGKAGDIIYRQTPTGELTEVAAVPDKESTLFGKIDPKDYTPESIKIFSQTGDYGSLVPIKKTTESSVFGKIDPKDYTQASLREFTRTGDYTKLVPIKKDSEGTEFERLISSLPPEEQQRYKEQYLRNKVSPNMSPALVPVIMKEESALSSLQFGASDVANSIADIKSGTLKLGLKDNFVNSLKTIAGKSDEGSRAFSRFNTALEQLRNARLNLNVGVQTEGDAVRAANEFLANYDRYDTQTALVQLERVFGKIKTAYESKQRGLKATLGASGTQLPDTFYTPFPTIKGMSTGKPQLSDDELRVKFNAAAERYPEWKTKGFEAYKKQVLGQ